MILIGGDDMAKTVMVGLSGGVDSSVAAALLKEQGYDVIGFTLNLWNNKKEDSCDKSCCGLEAVEDARRICRMLDIPYYVFNYKDLFYDAVVQDFLDSYVRGETPNPCVQCNKAVKFGAAMHKMEAMGIDYIATGHYANVEYDQESGRYLLKKSKDEHKDQTYMLYHLSQKQLSHIIMPLARFQKPQVREIAKRLGFEEVAAKADSQDICFLEGNSLEGFLREIAPQILCPGDIVDQRGKVLGRHGGTPIYTIGQRRGLGVAGEGKTYVTQIDAQNNRIVLGQNQDLFADTLIADQVNYIPFDALTEPMAIQAKIRYAAKPQPGILYPIEDGKAKVVFDQPQRAITKGQAVVFYDGDLVLGGGTIL